MPFKIVQTIDKGKFVLDIVPHKWEKNGTLHWPRKNVEILKKFDQSEPEDNWITYGCILKKTNLVNYQKAEFEMSRMRVQSINETDTDNDDSSSRSRRVPSQLHNYDDSNNQPNSSNYAMSGYSKMETLPYEDFDDSVTEDNVSFDAVQQSSSLRTDVLLTKMNTILRNIRTIKENYSQIQEQLKVLNEGQLTLLNNMNEISFQLQSAPSTLPMMNKPNSVMEPIKTQEEFENFDQLLRNPDKENELIQKYSIICGVRKGKGINNAYELIDALFDRRFLPECSWAGGSRTGESKICFKSYTHTINFFFKLIHMSDNSFSLTDCHDFLKIVLRNSRQRCASKNLRKSAPKSRRKKRKIIEDPLDTTETSLDPCFEQSQDQVNQSTDEDL